MKAIEIHSKTDESGFLRINYQLNKSEKSVRIIILLDDNKIKDDEEKLLLYSISKNPSFDFLNDSSEDIYSINDGEPFND